jgi:hypothetical protein
LGADFNSLLEQDTVALGGGTVYHIIVGIVEALSGVLRAIVLL